MNTEHVRNEAPVLQPQTDAPKATIAASMMMCEVCDLVGGPFAPREAAHLRAIHDRLHHGIMSAAA